MKLTSIAPINKSILLIYLTFSSCILLLFPSSILAFSRHSNTTGIPNLYKPMPHTHSTTQLAHVIATATSPSSSITTDMIEIAKIMSMTTINAVAYGIVHDLITTQINFDYFASDRTHHGPYTKAHFPFIYRTNNKILYALLWGTIATWWVGLPLGIICGIAARCNSKKLTWHNLMKPMSLFSVGMLTTSIIVGLLNYVNYKDSFEMVAVMHQTSYITGIVGGILMAYYLYNYTPEKSSEEKIIQFEPNSITINLVRLFGNK
ncbi:MAG: hypothetical protein BGO68_02335 [Candidatus Amoebophilus sp. 36-38]|nr:MAG: hypothetical protein BGO68_02335 [Candidatus Amoebophilus sp. 36-38]